MKKTFKILLFTALLSACLQSGVSALTSVSVNYNADDGIVSIGGNAGSENAGANVTVAVLQSGLESADISGITKENVADFIQYSSQLKVADDGTFGNKFTFYDGVTGVYNVRISCPGMDSIYEESIYYLTEADVADVLSQVNAAGDSAEVKSLIESGIIGNLLSGTPLEELSDKDTDKIARAIFESKPYAKLSELTKEIKNQSLLALFRYDDKYSIIEGYMGKYYEYFAANTEIYDLYLNLSNKSDVIKSMVGEDYADMSDMSESFEQSVIAEYFSEQDVWTYLKSELLRLSEKYSQYPLFKELDISGFKKLSDNGQYKVMENIIKNRKTIAGAESFAELFNESVEDAENSKSSDKNSGSSSGGGGGGSSSGGSGFGNVAMTNNTANNTNTEEEPEQNQEFTDLENVLWAKESILALKNAGIVSGRSETEFVPSAPVKREEFIKMLTAAFGLSADGYAADFKDTDSNAWYYPYVSAAQKAKIAYGDDEGNFGVGKNITREDMAVMLYRMINLQGIELAAVKEAADFADSSEISGYAKEAVSALQQAGVINGMEDGTFMPKKSSTRAEAAAMLYGILKTAGRI